MCYLHSTADGVGILMKDPSHFQTLIVWWTQFDECCNTQLVSRTRFGSQDQNRSKEPNFFTDLFPSLPVMAPHQEVVRILNVTRNGAHLLLKQLATNTHICFGGVYPQCNTGVVAHFLHWRLTVASKLLLFTPPHMHQTFRADRNESLS